VTTGRMGRLGDPTGEMALRSMSMARQEQGRRTDGRHGGTNPVVVLLAGILAALVVLIGVLVTQKGGIGSGPSGPPRDRSEPVVADGQTVRRSELSNPPHTPKPVGDPERIKETLRPGKTYHVVLKAGLVSRVEDKAWGLKEVVSLAYATEMAFDRTIEVNDGKAIVARPLLCRVAERQAAVPGRRRHDGTGSAGHAPSRGPE